MPRPRLAPVLAILPLLGGCDVFRLGIVGHAGPVADSTWHLYLIVGAVLVFVAGPVLLLTPIMAWHYRLSNKRALYRPTWIFSWVLEALIWLPPAGIVVGLSIVLWHYTHSLDPYRPLASKEAPLEIEVVALDWKWLFLYPGEHVASVNQLAVPVGRPVHLRLTSGTVMQSMLVPQLAGQIYAMPGMTTQLHLAASRPGMFRGRNTQFNGDGFPQDRFDVVALAPAPYAAWLKRVRGSTRTLDGAEYDRLRQRSVERKPLFYAAAPPGLFRHALALSAKPAR